MQNFKCICHRFKFMIKVAEQETNLILPWPSAFPTVTILLGYRYTAKITGNVLKKYLYFKCNKGAWAQCLIIHLKQAKGFWGQSLMFSYVGFFSSGPRWKEECHPSCSVCEWESGPRSVSISLWFSTASWESINSKEKFTEKGNFM